MRGGLEGGTALQRGLQGAEPPCDGPGAPPNGTNGVQGAEPPCEGWNEWGAGGGATLRSARRTAERNGVAGGGATLHSIRITQ